MSLGFIFNSVLLGVGLAMDALSVSVADAMREPGMRKRKALLIAGAFGLFQCMMPLIGYFCVQRIAEMFHSFEPAIPWIALILLVLIGGKMILEGIRGEDAEEGNSGAGAWEVLLQAVATSVDALSVGFAIAGYTVGMALAAGGIIGLVTFLSSCGGILIGFRFGRGLASRASIVGGCILIAVGLEIFFL